MRSVRNSSRDYIAGASTRGKEAKRTGKGIWPSKSLDIRSKIPLGRARELINMRT